MVWTRDEEIGVSERISDSCTDTNWREGRKRFLRTNSRKVALSRIRNSHYEEKKNNNNEQI